MNIWSDLTAGLLGPTVKRGQIWIFDDFEHFCIIKEVNDKHVTAIYDNGAEITHKTTDFRFVHTFIREAKQ